MKNKIIVGVDISDLKVAATGQKTFLSELHTQFLSLDTKNNANANDVKSRLRKQLEEKRLAEQTASTQTTVSPVTATLNTIEEDTEQNQKLQENINRIKALTNKL